MTYDPTTLALSHAVNGLVQPTDKRSFEMGIGQAALVSLSLARHRHLSLEGADCSAARVATSRTVAKHNGLEASFSRSDLFANVPAKSQFDLIFFNVPYVPCELGQKLKLTERIGVDGDQMWDGGIDGTDVLQRFLREATPFLAERGRLVFGVQNIFVSDERVCEVIRDCGWNLVRRCRRRFVPSCCCLVKPVASC